MRTKQSAIRRVASSDDEDGSAAADASPLNSPEAMSRPQPQPPQLSVLAATINGQGQLEDGTVVVQPEAADATDDNQIGCFDQAASSARCTAPGIYDTIKCTACGKRVNPYNGTMEVHPLLKVLVCHKCFKFYASGHFDADEEGKENQCRWCGEGGSLICCDNCEHSFCRTCIKRNLGRSAMQDIESLPDESVWLCYACDQGALRQLQEEANIVMKAVRDHFKEASKRSEKQKVSIAAKKAVATNSQQPHPQQQQQQQHQHHRPAPASVPVFLSTAPAIAAYGSVRGGAGTTTSIGGIQLDLSAVPKVRVPQSSIVQQQQQQQGQLQPHRQQHYGHHHHSGGNQQPLLQHQQHQHQLGVQTVPGSPSVTQRTEQWYKQNVRIETILADIESVDTRNIGTALNATVSLLQGMMRQYSRFMQDLMAATTQLDKAQIVSRFKSAYRMHLFLRLGKLRSLIAEEDKHLMRKSAARAAAASSTVIDLTDPAPVGAATVAAARPQVAVSSASKLALVNAALPSLLFPLARAAQPLAPHPQQHRHSQPPQPSQALQASPMAGAQLQAQRTARQRPDRASPHSKHQQPPPPPELIVVLSDDDDNDDENNNGDAGHVAAGKDQPGESTEPSAASIDAAPTSLALLSTASSNGGKPAAILELLEARRRREKGARKPQQPRRIAAVVTGGDGDGDGVENDDAAAVATTSSTSGAPVSEPERPASSSSLSSSASASGAGAKRRPTEDAAADDDNNAVDSDTGQPPSEKRPRHQHEGEEIETEPDAVLDAEPDAVLDAEPDAVLEAEAEVEADTEAESAPALDDNAAATTATAST